MKKFFSILFFLSIFVSLLIVSCRTTKPSVDYDYGSSYPLGSRIMNTTDYTVKRNEFNSICQKLKIPSNLNLWLSREFNDYETNKPIKELFYMRNGDESNIYRLKLNILNNDTTFVLIHRQISEK